jgi:hypothetical protein
MLRPLPVTLIATVLVLALVGVYYLARGTGPSTANGPSAAQTQASPESAFFDTPAATYPAGEAGITVPEAKGVTGFTSAQVQSALSKVKQGLVAARLDPAMLTTHDQAVLVGLLAPDDQANVRADFDKKRFFVYATEIAPGHELATEPVRVRGTMTYQAATHDGVRMLEVVTNYVWVYPFVGPAGAPGDRLVVVHDRVTWAFPLEADVASGSRGMWIYGADGYVSNMDCSLLDQSMIGPGKPTASVPAMDSDAAYDPNTPFTIKSTC